MSYTIAKYIRLSSEDVDKIENGKLESFSVTNQRDLLNNFIGNTAEFQGCNVLEFCDDGRSGTNFDRPAVRALLEQAEKGNIHCIIVKDLSRFGRNYIEVGDYLEQIFPKWGVRFIAVNDMFDSNQYFGMTGGIDIAFRNLVYDIYCKDLSEKVRSAKKVQAKKGDFFSPYAFFGYLKSPDDKHKLIINEETADIVRTIFNLAEQGQSTSEIAKLLNAQNVPTAQMFQKKNNVKRNWNMIGESNFWTATVVNKILRDERYAGKYIGCKTKKCEIGKANARLRPKSEWIVIEDVLPSIISKEQFDVVNMSFREKRKNATSYAKGENKLFYRKIKCGTCKMAMDESRNKNLGTLYLCRNKSVNESLACTSDRISESDITKTVLATIRQQAGFAKEIHTQKVAASKKTLSEEERLKTQISKLNTDIEKIEIAKLSVYEKYREGRVSKEAYVKASSEMTASISENQTKIGDIEKQITNLKIEQGSENLFVERFKDHARIQKLTQPLVDELVKMVYIYDSKHIEVVLNYADEYAELLV